MPRKKKNLKTFIGGEFDVVLATKFLALSKSQGVSQKEGLRRVMTQAVIDGKLPGIDILDIERRENAKYGTATPTFDGSVEEGSKSGQTSPAGRAE